MSALEAVLVCGPGRPNTPLWGTRREVVGGGHRSVLLLHARMMLAGGVGLPDGEGGQRAGRLF